MPRIDDIDALVNGVLGAPEATDPAGWLCLIDPPPGAAEAAALLDRVAHARAGNETGLGVSPAPPERLAALRAELARRGLDGFVVPLADEHQGEFVPPRAQRLAWLTGFAGSAGLAIVLARTAAIFVDGRYVLQVENQVDTERFRPLHLARQTPTDWLAETLSAGSRLGYDPWLHTLDGLARLEAACADAGAALVAVADNPIDAVWPSQPAPPISPAVPHGVDRAGLDSAAKRAALADNLTARKIDAVVLSAPDSIAWLLNMRGGDVPNTPLVLSFAILESSGAVALFVDPRKITGALSAAFAGTVAIHPPAGLGPALDELGKAGRRVRIDPRTAPAWIAHRLREAGCEPVRGPDPCAMPKACKNMVELAGARAAHVRDGRALVRFLAWLESAAPSGAVTELDASRELYRARATDPLFRGVSFDAIAGAGANGAIVHYRVDEASNRTLEPGAIFLIDSGGQYLDGTTDVTRTVHVRRADGAPPPAEIRDRFTRVLKGHIAVAAAVFPNGVNGCQLDTLARAALWRAGLDYDHGTGHGVGSFLGVHEGPQRISKVGASAALAPGMILSNEPGYYKAGAYGIRIENLVVVVEHEAPAGAELPLLALETITFAPIDRALIEPALMTPDEIAWLDRYHETVFARLAPGLDEGPVRWLGAACAPL